MIILKGINFYSLFYTTLCTLCSGFVLISSAAGLHNNPDLFPSGTKTVYTWRSGVLLNEIGKDKSNVGFFVHGQVTISSLWSSGNNRILKVEVNSPQLHSGFNDGPNVDNLEKQWSNLNSYHNNPFIVVISSGVVTKIYINEQEDASLTNIKKGIASLLQIQSSETKIETDSSGQCNVTYSHANSDLVKSKYNCVSDDIENHKHLHNILGTSLSSTRFTQYQINYPNKILQSVNSQETHDIFIHAKQDIGSTLKSYQTLSYEQSKKCDASKAQTLENAIIEIINEEGNLKEELLLTNLENRQNERPKKLFSKEVASLRSHLKDDYLGSIKSAKAFLTLLSEARTASSEDISKTLKSKKNQDILAQIYDILGYAQTENSHSAVMKHLHLDNDEQIDLVERYLWALSLSSHPNVEIMNDLLKKFKQYTNIPEKTRDTLILSLASMGRNLRSSKGFSSGYFKVLQNVEETLINGLDYAQDEDRFVYLNALKNLKSPTTVPKLISILHNGTLKEEVLAWRALKSFDKPFWTTDLIKQAKKTIFQLDRKHDTSSRTLATDLLLDYGLSDSTLDDLLKFVASNDTNFEIRQYVFQKIKMFSERDESFSERVQRIIRNSKILNNYSSLSPRGLSTALSRNIYNGFSSNGSLVSVQEIKGGIVKRGVVDVIVEKNNEFQDVFTLGIFAGGLSSFVSSNSEDEQDEEAATAGMELAIMGTQIRPFVFFEGNGELMGHVWSGTASEMTPAFQALILTLDHEERLRLGNGFVVDINLKGAVSLDLSGKIEISIWGRNAQSLIKKSVGFVTQGLVKVDTSFISSQVDFEGTLEPQLNLEIDADFSSNVKLCMRLSQPNSIFRREVTKSQTVTGTKVEAKLTDRRKAHFAGVTYALNKKNNNMCSALFS